MIDHLVAAQPQSFAEWRLGLTPRLRRDIDMAQMRKHGAEIIAIVMRALSRHRFVPERFRELTIPVLLQIGSESPPDLYVTDALAATLLAATIETLTGQAHEGMTTAPEQYVVSVRRYLMS